MVPLRKASIRVWKPRTKPTAAGPNICMWCARTKLTKKKRALSKVGSRLSGSLAAWLLSA